MAEEHQRANADAEQAACGGSEEKEGGGVLMIVYGSKV
jgi:hypothetical protein